MHTGSSHSIERRPNILFLMTDQHRWDALGSVNPRVRTPNLDALAARGVRFGQATCNAVMCVPSRYSMMTGLYPSQAGVRHNQQMCPTDADLPVPVLAERLHRLGYQTAGFGKTHWYVLGAGKMGVKLEQSRRGFEIRAQRGSQDPSGLEPGAASMYVQEPVTHLALQEESKSFGAGGEGVAGYKGVTSAVPGDRHVEAWLTDQALDFLDNGRDERPFFLYVSFDFPHAGFQVPPGYEELYIGEDFEEFPLPPEALGPEGHARSWSRDWWRSTTPAERRTSILRYYALCTYVDEQFGRILRKLEEMGEADNTLIVFVSDHGEMLGERRRFSKYCLYESSVRVPLILAGPQVPGELRGTVDERPAELVDLLPTLLEASGEPAPAELPGTSLIGGRKRRGAFAEFHGSGYEPVQKAPSYMWRTKDWKLILYLEGNLAEAEGQESKGELYNLREDPGEWVNLYDDPACLAIRERLARELLMHIACQWAKYPRQAARPPLR